MLPENTQQAIEILKSNGYDRNDYQGPEFRDRTGCLNECMDSANDMFIKWINVVIENWPGSTDRMVALKARNSAINAINQLWRVGE